MFSGGLDCRGIRCFGSGASRLLAMIHACLSLVLLVFAASAQALTVSAYSFEQLVERSDVIVVGTVRDISSSWDASGQTIYTHASLDELEVIKGDVPAAVYELQVPGGVVGGAAQVYPGVPRLAVGARYVLFIRGDRQTFIPFVGAYQGVYSVLRAGGEERVYRYDQQPSPNALSGVLTAPQAPSLDEFVSRIRRLDDAGAGDLP
jgi:hypothetical protein